MDQRGDHQHLAAADGDVIASTSSVEGKVHVALFHLGDTPAKVRAPFAHYGLGASLYTARDLWEYTARPAVTSVEATSKPHGTVLLELKPGKPTLRDGAVY